VSRSNSKEVVPDGPKTDSERDTAAMQLAARLPKAQVARLSSVARSTLYRWWEDPGFQEEVQRYREVFEGNAEQRLLVQALAALSSVLTDPKATNAERIRAAEAAQRLLRPYVRPPAPAVVGQGHPRIVFSKRTAQAPRELAPRRAVS